MREIDGRLRTGTGAERDRMYRTYFQAPDRPVIEPAIFEDPALSVSIALSFQQFLILTLGCIEQLQVRIRP